VPALALSDLLLDAQWRMLAPGISDVARRAPLRQREQQARRRRLDNGRQLRMP